MVAKSKLKPGTHYYFVLYEDRELTVPVIETLRYRNEVRNDAGDGTLYLFDKLGESKPKQSRLTEDLLHTVFEFEGLVSELEANRQAQREGRPFEPSQSQDC